MDFALETLLHVKDTSLKQFKGHGEVIDYGWDNNEVLVKCNDKEIKCVAEWMDIVTKVEDL